MQNSLVIDRGRDGIQARCHAQDLGISEMGLHLQSVYNPGFIPMILLSSRSCVRLSSANHRPKTKDFIKSFRGPGDSIFTACPVSLMISSLAFGPIRL